MIKDGKCALHMLAWRILESKLEYRREQIIVG